MKRTLTLSFLLMAFFAAFVTGCDKIDEEIDEIVTKYVSLSFETENDPSMTDVSLEFLIIGGQTFRPSSGTTSGDITVTTDVPFTLSIRSNPTSNPQNYTLKPYSGTIAGSMFNQSSNNIHVVINNLLPTVYVNNKVASTVGGGGGNGGGGNGGGGSNVDTILTQLVDGNVHEKKIVKFNVPTGAKTLSVRLTEFDQNTERNTADLFVREGADPIVNHDIQSNDYTWIADCAGVNPNREDELCTFNNPGSGQWAVMLYGYNTWFTSRLVITITK